MKKTRKRHVQNSYYLRATHIARARLRPRASVPPALRLARLALANGAAQLHPLQNLRACVPILRASLCSLRAAKTNYKVSCGFFFFNALSAAKKSLVCFFKNIGGPCFTGPQFFKKLFYFRGFALFAPAGGARSGGTAPLVFAFFVFGSVALRRKLR